MAWPWEVAQNQMWDALRRHLQFWWRLWRVRVLFASSLLLHLLPGGQVQKEPGNKFSEASAMGTQGLRLGMRGFYGIWQPEWNQPWALELAGSPLRFPPFLNPHPYLLWIAHWCDRDKSVFIILGLIHLLDVVLMCSLLDLLNFLLKKKNTLSGFVIKV